MPRKNSSTRAVNDTVTAARMNDINEDFDDLYENGPDRLRVYRAVSGTALRIDISAGSYYIGSTSGVYGGGTDIVVTNAVTNYVMIDNTGTITISTSARTAGLGRLAQVVCSGGAVTSIILRNNMVFGGAALDITALTEDTNPDEENDFLFSLDVSAGINKKVKPKNLDIRPYIEGIAGESITAGQPVRYANALSGDTITVNGNGGFNGNARIGYNTTNEFTGASFTLVNGGLLTSILVSMKKVGSPTGTLTMKVFADADLVNAVATSSNTISESTMTTSFVDKTFSFSSIYLPPGVYRRRIEDNRANSTVNYSGVEESTNSYAGGTGYGISSTPTRSNSGRDYDMVVTVATTGETSGRLYRTSASFSYQVGFIGFARTTVTAGNTLQVDTTLTKNQSGLTALSDYYLANTAGTISTSAGTVSKKIGKALSATELAIEYNPA